METLSAVSADMILDKIILRLYALPLSFGIKPVLSKDIELEISSFVFFGYTSIQSLLLDTFFFG
jgi:hypothetical protein